MMANSFAALKSLACPAGDKCTAFKCLFKHDSDVAPVVTPAATINGLDQSDAQTLTTSSSDQISPRKRVKLDSTQAAPSHQLATRETKPQVPTVDRGRVKRDATTMSTQGEQEGASRRTAVKVAGQNNGSPSQAHGSSSSSTSPSTGQTRKIAKPVAKTPPQKPEALNPRLLKRSPSQHDTRLKLVKALHEQYTRLNSELKKEVKGKESKRLVLSDQELIVKTLDDEQEIAIKRYAIYGNAIRNKIMAVKKMNVAQWKQERMEATKTAEEEDAENAPPAPEPIVTGLTVAQEIDFLHRLVWPLEGLTSFGYVASPSSDDDIKKARESVEISGNVEVCDRCTRRFQVFPGRRKEDGALTSNGSCTYHPGKIYYGERIPILGAQAQKKYRCCHRNVDDESGGCTTAPTHVFKTTDPHRLASLLNFAHTPANPDVPADRAVGFDCEMGYTSKGLELIRMTLVSWPGGEKLLDILVQPFGEILDLNTRFSGVTPEDMVSAERWKPGDDHQPTAGPSGDPAKPSAHKGQLKIAPSPKAARDLLFSLISTDTPFIGHGLENDLNAARLIHPTCIDTVLLYPHKRGLPVRNGLRYLMDALLDRKIQVVTDDDQPEGHDSAEDARAAGELVRLKIRDEWKDRRMKGWTVEDGKVVPPKDGGYTVVGGAKRKA